jgi:mRNA interferase RelE/StbE
MTSPRKLRISGEIRDLIRHMHPDLKQKVRVALSEIVENPSCGKSLLEELEGMRSFRVSSFRIIYRSVSNVIEVIAIGPRRSIYGETIRLLKKEEFR